MKIIGASNGAPPGSSSHWTASPRSEKSNNGSSATMPSSTALARTASASATLRDLVQYAVELRPNLVSLGAGDVAKRAFRFCLHLGGRSLWLVMIEIEVSPASGVGKALGVLDGHIRAIELAREITPSRRLRS